MSLHFRLLIGRSVIISEKGGKLENVNNRLLEYKKYYYLSLKKSKY